MPGKLVTGIACILIVVHAALPVYGQKKADRIDRAIDLSGFSGQLERLGPAILSSIPDDAFGADGARRRAERQLGKDVDKAVLKEIMREAIIEDRNDAFLKEVVGFYESRLGREVSHLTRRALAPRVLNKLEENGRAFDLLSPDRRVLVEQLVSATNAAELNTELLVTAVHGLAEAPMRQVHTRDRPLREIREDLNAIADRIRKNKNRSRETALEAYAYTLRSLNDEELKALIRFYQSPQGRWFTRCAHKGLDRAVFRVAAAIGEIMAGENDPPNQREDRE